MQNFDDFITNLYSEIKNDVHGHTEFQIKNFIIGSQPTDYGKYRQCILELRTRINTYNSLKQKLNELSQKDNQTLFELKTIEEYSISIEDIKREIYIIYNIFLEVKENIKGKDLKELEIEYWDRKFDKEIISHLMVGNPIPVGLLQNVMSLPDNCKCKQNINHIVSERISYINNHGQRD